MRLTGVNGGAPFDLRTVTISPRGLEAIQAAHTEANVYVAQSCKGLEGEDRKMVRDSAYLTAAMRLSKALIFEYACAIDRNVRAQGLEAFIEALPQEDYKQFLTSVMEIHKERTGVAPVPLDESTSVPA